MLKLLLLAAAAAATTQPLVAEMQRVETSRNAAIKAGDMAALGKLYAPEFRGLAASGASVGRDTLFGVFKRNAGGDFVADSKILRARRINRLVFAEGRLKLMSGDGSKLLSDSVYLHVYRWRAGHWEMIEGASAPVQQSR